VLIASSRHLKHRSRSKTRFKNTVTILKYLANLQLIKSEYDLLATYVLVTSSYLINLAQTIVSTVVKINKQNQR